MRLMPPSAFVGAPVRTVPSMALPSMPPAVTEDGGPSARSGLAWSQPMRSAGRGSLDVDPEETGGSTADATTRLNVKPPGSRGAFGGWLNKTWPGPSWVSTHVERPSMENAGVNVKVE